MASGGRYGTFRGMEQQHYEIIVVGLNPAIDRTVEIRNFTIGAHQKAKLVSRTPGGKAFNVLGVLADYGVECTFAGFIERDSYEEFDEYLLKPCVADALVFVNGRTRENLTIIDPAAGTETHIREPGSRVTSTQVRQLGGILWDVQNPDYQPQEHLFVFSGSLRPGVSAAQFADWVGQCHRRGAKVVVDASGRALQAIREAPLYLLAPNVAEFGEYLGREFAAAQEAVEAADEALESVENILLSAGAEGAWLLSRQGRWHARVPLPPEDVVNTVGCGDTLLGAFLTAVAFGHPLTDALSMGVAAASASACTTRPAGFSDKLCRKLLRKIELRAL